MDVTVVIPIGPMHEHLAARAIASAENQTVPVRVVTVLDTQKHGAGWARNQGLRQVTTPWVLFLDADDWLEPNAVERMLWQAEQVPGMYVYTDWYDGIWHEAPNTGHAWCGGTWHTISALIPTAWARDVGGFDETLPAGEDTDFFLRLTTSLHCGIRLSEPLLHYSADGQRGALLVQNPEVKDRIWHGFTEKYGGKVGCCGQINVVTPGNEHQEGDILAIALWGGNQRKVGPATGRLYPRSGNGARMWIAEADLRAAPHFWQRVDVVGDAQPVDAMGVVTSIEQLANMMLPSQTLRYRPERAVEPPPAFPDVARIIRMGLEALG